MTTSAPKQITWWVSLIIGVIGILSNFVEIPVLSDISFWLVVIGFGILVLATAIKDL